MTRVTIRSPKVNGRMPLISASERPMGSSSSGSSSMSPWYSDPGAPYFRFVLGQKETPIGSAYRLRTG
jgi:hypothetical protein